MFRPRHVLINSVPSPFVPHKTITVLPFCSSCTYGVSTAVGFWDTVVHIWCWVLHFFSRFSQSQLVFGWFAKRCWFPLKWGVLRTFSEISVPPLPYHPSQLQLQVKRRVNTTMTDTGFRRFFVYPTRYLLRGALVNRTYGLLQNLYI